MNDRSEVGVEDRSDPLKVLMLTYFYPPLGGAGVQRSLKFSRYLPESGVWPTVISADSDGYPHDLALEDEIPSGVSVTRIRHTPILTKLMVLRRRLLRVPSAEGSGSAAPASTGPGGSSRFRDWFLSASAAVQFPDDKAGWAAKAERRALQLISRNPFDLLFSSAPPVSGHRAAMRVAQKSGIPWIADYRDLWTGNPAYGAPTWRRDLDRRVERRMLASAGGIVAVTRTFVADLGELAGPNVPILRIPNGYDEEDFHGLDPAPREPGVFRFVHTGTFYGQRSPRALLRAAEQLLANDEGLRRRLRLRLVGNVGSRFNSMLTAFSQRFPGVLELPGYVGHRRALSELLGADALVLVVGGGDAGGGSIPGKVFEYLRAGRPILLIGSPRSEAADLIRECQAGAVIDEADEPGIVDVLERWVNRGSLPAPDPLRASQFDRRALTRQLAEFMFDVHGRFQREGLGRR